MRLIAAILGLAAVSAAAQPARAEYFVLRSGQRLSVTGYQLVGDTYKLQLQGGSAEISAAEVVAIEPEEVFTSSPAAVASASPYGELIRAAAARYAVDADLVTSVIAAESNFDPKAVSRKNARGLMQLLPGTAQLVARRSGLAYNGGASLYDPAINIPLGTQYLANLAVRFDGSPWLASAAYNAGPANAQRWVDAHGSLDPETFILTIPFNETRDYVTRVMSFATIYGWRLHDEPVPISSRLPAIGTPYDPGTDPARKQVVCRVPQPAPATTTSPAAATGKPSP